MLIKFNGNEYDYDPRRLDVATSVKISEATGMGLVSWEKACLDMSPIAVQALYWAVLRQNGQLVDLRAQNFSIIDFMEAFFNAAAAEAEAAAAPDPTQTVGSQSPTGD